MSNFITVITSFVIVLISSFFFGAVSSSTKSGAWQVFETDEQSDYFLSRPANEKRPCIVFFLACLCLVVCLLGV